MHEYYLPNVCISLRYNAIEDLIARNNILRAQLEISIHHESTPPNFKFNHPQESQIFDVNIRHKQYCLPK